MNNRRIHLVLPLDQVSIGIFDPQNERWQIAFFSKVLMRDSHRQGAIEVALAISRLIAMAPQALVRQARDDFGCGEKHSRALEHMVEGIRDGHATAVLAASIFHFGEQSVREAKSYMAKAGLPMRLDP